MKLTPLERAALKRFLQDEDVGAALDVDSVEVVSRELTGAGFFANLANRSDLRLFPPGSSDRRGDVHAAVGDRHTQVGFVFGIEDGRLRDIEGFTYGEPWPEAVDNFELLDVKITTGLDTDTDSSKSHAPGAVHLDRDRQE